MTRSRAFDVGINDRLPLGQLLVLGLQHVFGMTGMFVFPGLLGRSFNLPAERIAYLYGMTFVVCGLITILQSVWLLRLPVVQGTYAGNFAALLAVGHMQSGGLGVQNLKRRLELLYPEKHELNIYNTGNMYQTILKLQYDN